MLTDGHTQTPIHTHGPQRTLSCAEPLGRTDKWVAQLAQSALSWTLQWYAHLDFCLQAKRALVELCASVAGLWFAWGGTDITHPDRCALISNVFVYYGRCADLPYMDIWMVSL